MLNEKIRELRLARNLNQVQLGDALGVSKQCISNWENDNILPSIDMLVKIARYFNVSCDLLLGLTTEKSIDVSFLSEEQIAHICMIIDDLRCTCTAETAAENATGNTDENDAQNQKRKNIGKKS